MNNKLLETNQKVECKATVNTAVNVKANHIYVNIYINIVIYINKFIYVHIRGNDDIMMTTDYHNSPKR